MAAVIVAAKYVLAVVMGAAWAFAGWRNMPRLDQPESSALGLAIGGSVALAYWAGTRRKRDAAVAVAVARAEATALSVSQANLRAQQQVAVFIGDPSQGAAAAGRREFGIEDAPWMVGARRVDELEGDAIDTALQDVMDEREAEIEKR